PDSPATIAALFPYTTLFRSDPEFIAERSGLAEEIHMTGMEEIEDPRRHYTDHKRHARTMSCPSRNTRFLARAYAFASCFERARPDRKSTRLNSSHEWISYAV